MIAYSEAASSVLSLPDAPSIKLLFPEVSDEVTASILFRTAEYYSGRGDAWIADSTTGPCRKGDCRGKGSVYRPHKTVSTDDLQELPTALDETATPPSFIPHDSALPSPQLLMYYRHDLFASRSWSPPATWTDLAAWAEAVNGTVDADGDGAGDWALCMDTMLACKSGFLVMAIMASKVQPSTPLGTFFQPETMAPLARSKAFVEALSTYSLLANFSLPSSPDALSCRPYEPGFSSGRCLLTISFDQLRAAADTAAWHAAADVQESEAAADGSSSDGDGDGSGGGGSSSPRGVLPADAIGVAPLPGSEQILDRETGSMVQCEEDTCPNAVKTTCAAAAGSQQPRSCLINRAPLIASLAYETAKSEYLSDTAWARVLLLQLQLNATTHAWAHALARTVTLGGTATSGPAADPPASVAPGPAYSSGADGGQQQQQQQQEGRRRRGRQLRGERQGGGSGGGGSSTRRSVAEVADLPSWIDIEPLVELGLSEAEAARYLAAYWVPLLGPAPTDTKAAGPQRNVVQELQLRGSSYFTNIYAQAAAWVVHGGVSSEQAAQWAAEQTDQLLNLVATNRSRLAFKYCKDIGWRPAPAALRGNLNEPQQSSAGSGGGGLNAGQLTAVIVVPVVAVCLAAAVAVLAVVWLRRRRWLGYRTVGPPGPGLGTTLILTDIQNSTVLWETLPADVMDAAIRCHHDVLRGLLAEHKGYESATEGDAFILAFHTAEDAARYAVVAQEKLLAAPWPQEMLTHPDCEVVWMAPQRSDPTACLSYINRELLNAIHRTTTGLPTTAASPHSAKAGIDAAAAGSTGHPGAGASAASVSALGAPRVNQSLLRRMFTSFRRGASGRGPAAARRASDPGAGTGGSAAAATAAGAVDGERGSGGRASAGRASGGRRELTVAVPAGPPGSSPASPSGLKGSGDSLTRPVDNILGRITRANSFRPGKARSRPMQSSGSETLPASPNGADRAPSRTHLTHLSPLMKCPSDIRSYMTETETELDAVERRHAGVGGIHGGSVHSPGDGEAIVPRIYDSNGVPLPRTAAAVLAAAGAAGGTGASLARFGQSSPLQRASGLSGSGFIDGMGGLERSTPTPSANTLLALTNSIAVVTLTESLRQGWKRTAGGSGAASSGRGAEAGAAAAAAAGPSGAAEAGGGGVAAGGGVADGGWAGGAEEEPRLAFRGMRVRMGLHTGADLNEVSLNKATGRTQYSGTFMTAAKAVCDSAHGGQVVCSPATFKRLPPGCLSKSAFLLHMGEHVTEEGAEPEALYQLLPYSLSCRLALFEPLRTSEYLSLGLPDAPVGRITVAFMYVIGAQTLLAWNPVVAGDALAIFQDTVAEQLQGTDGYVVELVDGLCLAAFRSASDALLWSLRCGRLLLTAPWSDELLEHELCEEVSLLLHSDWTPEPPPVAVSMGQMGSSAQGGSRLQPPSLRAAMSLTSYGPAQGHGSTGASAVPSLGSSPPPQAQAQRCFTLSRAAAIRHKTLMRGLRLKVGMDTGFVADSINATTGRMAYRGRPMNRAARIASKALAGQVHCSAAVWGSAAERLAALARAGQEEEVTASSLGLQSLKGVIEKIEVMSVSYKGTSLSAEEAALVTKRAPRTSQGSSTISSSNPTVFSGLVSALSLGHANTASATAAAAAAATLAPAPAAPPPMPRLSPVRASTVANTGGLGSRSSSRKLFGRRSSGDGGLQPQVSSERLSPGRHSAQARLLPFGLKCSKDGSGDGAAAAVAIGVGGRSTSGPPKETRSEDSGIGPRRVRCPSNNGSGASRLCATTTTAPVLGTCRMSIEEEPAVPSDGDCPSTSAPAMAAAIGAARGSGGGGSGLSAPLTARRSIEHIVVHLNPLHIADAGRSRVADGGGGGGEGGHLAPEGALMDGNTAAGASGGSSSGPNGGSDNSVAPSARRVLTTSFAGVATEASAVGDNTSDLTAAARVSAGRAAGGSSGGNCVSTAAVPTAFGAASPPSPSRVGCGLGLGAVAAAEAIQAHGSGSDPPASTTGGSGSGSKAGSSTAGSGAPTPASPGSPLSSSSSPLGADPLKRVITLSRRGDGTSCIGLLPMPPPPTAATSVTTSPAGKAAAAAAAAAAARRGEGGSPGGLWMQGRPVVGQGGGSVVNSPRSSAVVVVEGPDELEGVGAVGAVP